MKYGNLPYVQKAVFLFVIKIYHFFLVFEEKNYVILVE